MNKQSVSQPVSQKDRQALQVGIGISLGPESKESNVNVNVTRPPFKLSLMPPDSQVLIGHRFLSPYIIRFYAEHIQMHLKHLKFQL